jgi:hypothetical protein
MEEEKKNEEANEKTEQQQDVESQASKNEPPAFELSLTDVDL